MARYSFAERLLHRLALSSAALCEVQFDLECALEKPSADPFGHHVFVAGLARSGSTVLMRSLYGSGAFGTLTYRDMPFVMAPNLWARAHRYQRRKLAATERAHGDGIQVDSDSPEAFEEVFWRTFEGRHYLTRGQTVLRPHVPSAETRLALRKYVSLILRKSGSQRYLSKNNNNILRIDAVLEAFPDARVLIPFRHPAAQARSLLAQHKRFLEDADPFTHRYMQWLGHHEFGPNHLPFAFADGYDLPEGPAHPAYWEALWRHVYAYLFERFRHSDRVEFVCHEKLCADPAAWQRLARRLELGEAAASQYRQDKQQVSCPLQPELAALYAEISATCP